MENSNLCKICGKADAIGLSGMCYSCWLDQLYETLGVSHLSAEERRSRLVDTSVMSDLSKLVK